VGRLTPVKGQALLVDALAQLRADGLDASLTIVGEGPARAEIEDASRRLGVAAFVSLLGAIGQGEIRGLYEDASIFCLSSFAEGVPVVLMEAMAMEIPVVAPAIMGIPELVQTGVNGVLVRPGRADQLADAVRELAPAPDVRRRLGHAARRTVVEEFQIDRSAEQLAALFGARTGQVAAPLIAR
jgi:glycosyltransferase involved in cell wall biosynthesis